MTWVYAKSFFSDPLIAFFLLVAFYSLLSHRFDPRSSWLWVGGASLGLAILTKPATLINVPLFILYLCIIFIKTSDKPILYQRLFMFAIPIVAGVIGVMLFNWWRFETPFDTGYRNIGWTFPFFKGLYGLVLSPGKGYLLYNPIIIAALVGMGVFWHHHRYEFWLIVGLLLINLLFLAKYDHWHGGGSWGPRLLLPLTPLLILPLGSLLERLPPQGPLNLLFALLIALSVIVQIPGLSVNYARFLQRVYALSVEKFYERVTFEVAYSPLIGQWGEMREVVGNLRNPAIRAEITQIALNNNKRNKNTIEVLSANLPDFWFIYLGLLTTHNSKK
jgi:hypothetical protein